MRDGTKTRELINETALRLFAAQGIRETTIKDIARAADIAEGTLYRHYKSKDELAERLFMDHVTALGTELQELQAPEQSTRTKLLAIIRRFCEIYDQDPTVINYLFLTRHDHMAKMTPRMPNPYFVFRRVIRNAMAKGEIPKQDADIATSMVLGIVLQIVDTRIIGSRIKQKISGLADHLTAACLRVLNA
jgi:AcrR family transcriptional regulator